MKGLSIHQPWAWAIFHAGKDMENRAWSTLYRGELAVHATRLESGCRLPVGVMPPPDEALVLGAVIGLVEIVDVVRKSDSPWFSGPLGFVLRNPRLLAKPVHCPGNVGIWDVPDWVAKAIRQGGQPTKHERTAKTEETLPHSKEKTYSMEEIRRTHNQAYRPWTAEDDAYLRARFIEGATIDDLVQEFARQPGGIRARLRKVGLETGGRPGDGVGRPAPNLGTAPSSEAEGGPRRASEVRTTPAAPAAKIPTWRERRPNAGRVWTPDEDEVLVREFDAGVSLDEIAQRLGRGVFAVEVRLCKLGRVPRGR